MGSSAKRSSRSSDMNSSNSQFIIQKRATTNQKLLEVIKMSSRSQRMIADEEMTVASRLRGQQLARLYNTSSGDVYVKKRHRRFLTKLDQGEGHSASDVDLHSTGSPTTSTTGSSGSPGNLLPRRPCRHTERDTESVLEKIAVVVGHEDPCARIGDLFAQLNSCAGPLHSSSEDKVARGMLHVTRTPQHLRAVSAKRVNGDELRNFLEKTLGVHLSRPEAHALLVHIAPINTGTVAWNSVISYLQHLSEERCAIQHKQFATRAAEIRRRVQRREEAHRTAGEARSDLRPVAFDDAFTRADHNHALDKIAQLAAAWHRDSRQYSDGRGGMGSLQGEMDCDTLMRTLKKIFRIRLTPAEASALMVFLDDDGNGTVSRGEFFNLFFKLREEGASGLLRAKEAYLPMNELQARRAATFSAFPDITKPFRRRDIVALAAETRSVASLLESRASSPSSSSSDDTSAFMETKNSPVLRRPGFRIGKFVSAGFTDLERAQNLGFGLKLPSPSPPPSQQHHQSSSERTRGGGNEKRRRCAKKRGGKRALFIPPQKNNRLRDEHGPTVKLRFAASGSALLRAATPSTFSSTEDARENRAQRAMVVRYNMKWAALRELSQALRHKDMRQEQFAAWLQRKAITVDTTADSSIGAIGIVEGTLCCGPEVLSRDVFVNTMTLDFSSISIKEANEMFSAFDPSHEDRLYHVELTASLCAMTRSKDPDDAYKALFRVYAENEARLRAFILVGGKAAPQATPGARLMAKKTPQKEAPDCHAPRPSASFSAIQWAKEHEHYGVPLHLLKKLFRTCCTSAADVLAIDEEFQKTFPPYVFLLKEQGGGSAPSTVSLMDGELRKNMGVRLARASLPLITEELFEKRVYECRGLMDVFFDQMRAFAEATMPKMDKNRGKKMVMFGVRTNQVNRTAANFLL